MARLLRRFFSLVVLLALLVGCEKEPGFELVDVASLDPSIIVEMRYAAKDNFLKRALYPENRALLRRFTAERLVRVQRRLREQGYGLKIWDAYRPPAVQREMWKILPDERYVADPKKGSKHNRGAAVDVTLVDSGGREVEMPTAFDDFSEKAGAQYPNVSEAARKHREVLQRAMNAEGFLVFPTEWWHFDDKLWQKCGIVEIPGEAVAK